MPPILDRLVTAVREAGLGLVYGRAGIPRTVNGVPCRVLPRFRWQFTRDYDSCVAEYLREREPAGAVCASVGANMGIYPIQLAHWSGPSGTVFAFEPNPQSAAILRRHVTINGLGGRVRVVDAAVSSESGEGVFHAAGVDGMSRLAEPNPGLAGRSRPVVVRVDTLDAFFSLAGVLPGVLTMDVEGFEIAALLGAGSLFAARRVVAVVELHPDAWGVAGTDATRLTRWLNEYRLTVRPLSGQADPLAEYGHVALEPAAP